MCVHAGVSCRQGVLLVYTIDNTKHAGIGTLQRNTVSRKHSTSLVIHPDSLTMCRHPIIRYSHPSDTTGLCMPAYALVIIPPISLPPHSLPFLSPNCPRNGCQVCSQRAKRHSQVILIRGKELTGFNGRNPHNACSSTN